MSEFLIPDEWDSYHLPSGESVNIRFFADADRFRHFLEEHVLSDSEPWWDRLVPRKFRNSVRQKMRSGDVFRMQEALQAAFGRCITLLHDGISFSARFPVYVAFAQQRQRLGSAEWYETGGYYFLSPDGLLIVVRDNTLRTAYFSPGIKGGILSKGGNLSKRELFREAWKSVKDKVRAPLCRDPKYREEYKHSDVRLVTPENWERCPNLERGREIRRARWPGRSKMERTRAAAERLIETLDETKGWNDEYQEKMREERVFARVVELCASYLTEFNASRRKPSDVPWWNEATEDEKRDLVVSFSQADPTTLHKAISLTLSKLDEDIEATMEEAALEAAKFAIEFEI